MSKHTNDITGDRMTSGLKKEDRNKFRDNWDNIFNKGEADELHKPDNTTGRQKDKQRCKVQQTQGSVPKGKS